MSLPMVAIVGRPNVGKSSLLNCIARRRISIVDPTPGVTRDRVSTTVALGEGRHARYFELVDTGGIGIVDCDKLEEHVEDQIVYGIESAAMILFVVDARAGITPLDRLVAERLRRQKVPVILLANKIDEARVISEIGELHKLGFGEPLAISAQHNDNIDLVFERLAEGLAHLPPEQPKEEGMKLAMVGKRNAGKSTMTNALAGMNRVIVSDKPGTTRDSVDVQIDVAGVPLTLIDTAGVKKKRKLKDDIEFYSQHRAMRSVRRADVVAFLIDASVPIGQVDKKLAAAILEEFKPCLIVVNKWDLAKDVATPEDYLEYFNKEFPQLSFAPIIFTAAKDGFNVEQMVGLAQQMFYQARTRVSTAELNQVIEAILEKRGPSHRAGTKPPKIFYASQVSTEPPTVVLMVNSVESFDTNYQRFLVNQFREYLPFSEVPIRLMLRGKSKYGSHRQTPKDHHESEEPQDSQTTNE